MVAGITPNTAAEQTAPLRIVTATEEEMRAHESMLIIIAKASGGRCLWQPAGAPVTAPEQNRSSA